MAKERYGKGVVFLDGKAQLPEDAKFVGVLPLFKEKCSEDIKASRKMNINRDVEPCTCCKDVIKLLEATSKVPGHNRNFTLYKTEVYAPGETKWCYFLLIAEDEFPIVITEEFANKIMQNPEVGRDVAFNHWFDRWR